MTKWQAMREIIRLSRDPATYGRAVVLKTAMFARPAAPETAARLGDLSRPQAPIDLAALQGLPASTLGGAYARAMQRQRLTPLVVEPQDVGLAARNPVAVRYLVTHDLFHLVLGFDTSVAGEAGVYAFAAEQGYSPVPPAFLSVARLVLTLLMPWQARRMWRESAKGRRLARQAKFLLAYPFEAHWHADLADVTRDLGLAV
jgi:ubiquinone biosynthesis protein Coq4